MFFRLSLAFLFVLFSLTTAQAESRKIVVGLYDNKPMIFMENRRPKGLFIDILEDIARQEGWAIDYAYGSWETVFDKLGKGEIDLLPVVAWSEPRSRFIDFTQKSLLVNWGQVYVGSDMAVESIEDLRGKKIAIQPNDTHGQHFSDLMEKLNIDYSNVSVADYHGIFEALEQGTVHAGVVNKVFASVNESGFNVRSTPIVFNPIQIRYAVPEGDPANLLPTLDRHLDTLMKTKDSAYQHAMGKWFGQGKISLVPIWLQEAILITVALGGFSLLLILLLRSQVAAKTKELQETNECLRESEQKLRLHLDSSLSVPWDYDLKSQHFNYVGSQAGDVFGHPHESWTDFSSWRSKMHPDDGAWVPEYCHRATAVGRDYEVTYRVVTPANRVVWVQSVVAVLSGPGGPERLIGFSRDVTESKQAEETLQKSEKRYRQLVENIAEVVWEVDAEGLFTYISPNVLDIGGYEPEQLIGKGAYSFMPKGDAQRVTHGLATFKEAAEIFLKLEHRILHKSGRCLYFESTGFPFSAPNGDLLGYRGTSIDMTEKIETERDVQTLVESAVGIVGQDFFDSVTGKLCDWLDCDCAMIGEISEDGELHTISMILDTQPVGKRICQLQGSPWGETAQAGYCVYKESVGARFPDNADLMEMGAEGYVGTSLTNKQGETVGVLCCLSRRPLQITKRTRDVMKIMSARVSSEMERRDTEAEKNRLETKLQQAQRMETIGTLAGGIAHDFNNLLVPILGYAEMAQEDLPEGSPIKRSLNEIHTAAIRARDLVRQILTFSRQDSCEAKPMKIQPVLNEALKLIRSTISSTIEIKVEICEACGFIEADPTQIHQVVMNLLTNAYHAMEESGGVMTVGLTKIQLNAHGTLSPGLYLCLTVGDTGSGISEQLREKIFEPFFTTKANGKGTGMGLSVVHGIVKRLGGGIEVTSTPHMGTDMRVYFPVATRFSSKGKTRTPETISGGTERILLVDDEEIIVDIERQMLERLGYRVVAFTNSVDALSRFQADPDAFDLVISDLNMPRLPGDQFAAELTKIRPGIPVLLCTGFSDKLTEEKASAMGIRAFLMKPVVMSDLAEKIRDVLMEQSEQAG